MRNALPVDQVQSVYQHIANHYDFQHAFFTVSTDQRARKFIVNNTVKNGDSVLDAGAGTGSTGLLAIKKAGLTGQVTFFDLTDNMLQIAKKKAHKDHLGTRAIFETGDMVRMPFEDNSFDIVLSTFSLCPLYDPAKGAQELYRVVRPGGKIGIAHSTEPTNHVLQRLSHKLESFAWKHPNLSMGCRAVEVYPTLEKIGAKMIIKKYMGMPLLPFIVLVVEKPVH